MSPIHTSDAVIKLMKFVAVFEVGGTERQFVNLSTRLDKSRFALSFGCLRRTGPFLDVLLRDGIPIEAYPLDRFVSWRGLRQMLRLARRIRRERIDVVHAYSFYGNVFAVPAARLAGAPLVLASIRDDGVCLTPRQRAVQRVICRWADAIVVNAPNLKRTLVAEGFDPERVAVIGNGVDVERFREEGRRPGIRRQLDVPADAPLVGMIARLTKFKGAQYFVDAAAWIRQRHPDAYFVIAGPRSKYDDGFAARLDARVRELGLDDRLIFAGCRDDVPDLLRELTVFVQPSISEGMSNAVLEAMASGRAVVATDVGGMRDLVQDGVTGLLVPPADVAALVGGVDRLLEDPALRERTGQLARRIVFDEYSIERMVERTERLYLDLVAHAQARRWRRLPLGARPSNA